MATKVINTILNMRDNMSKGLLATAKNMEKVDKGSVSATRSVLRLPTRQERRSPTLPQRR